MNSGNEGHVLLGPKSLLTWRVSLSVAHGAAILSSIFRLHRRKKTGHFGIDDYFAMGALILDCAFFPTLWMVVVNSKDVLIAAAWLSQIIFIPLLWGTRISLAFSISRVIPIHQKTRKAAIFLVYLFGSFCVGFIIQVSVTCGQTYQNWSQKAPHQCPISSHAAIVRIIADCFCDIALVFVPFYAFWRRLKLTVTTRRLIKACFGASLLTAICTLLIAGILFSHHNSKSAYRRGETSFIASLMCHLIATISLLVCNLLIVVTSFYRFFRPEEVIRPIGAPQQPPVPPALLVPAGIAPPHANTTIIEANGLQQSLLGSLVSSSQNQSQLGRENGISSAGSVTQSTVDSAPSRLELTEIFETEFTGTPSEMIESSLTYEERN